MHNPVITIICEWPPAGRETRLPDFACKRPFTMPILLHALTHGRRHPWLRMRPCSGKTSNAQCGEGNCRRAGGASSPRRQSCDLDVGIRRAACGREPRESTTSGLIVHPYDTKGATEAHLANSRSKLAPGEPHLAACTRKRTGQYTCMKLPGEAGLRGSWEAHGCACLQQNI